MIQIINDGPAITSTTYWQSDHARHGLVYASFNAGTLRLLLPEPARWMLADMAIGQRVSIAPSIREPGCWDVVFENGTTAPFAITLDARQFDRTPIAGACPVTVWTADGCQLSLPGEIGA